MEILVNSDAATSPADVTAPSKEATPARPSWLPAKFKTPEDMVAAYGEAEKLIGKQSAKTPSDVVKAALTDKGLDSDAIAVEISLSKDGRLSTKTISELIAKGVTPDAIDTFVTDARVSMEAGKAAIFKEAGGEAEYAALINFAKSLPVDDIKAYNDAVGRGDVAAAKIMLRAFKAEQTAALGKDPKLTTDNGTPKVPGEGSESGDSYKNTDEYLVSVGDPRYARDPAFREEVYAKLAKSSFWKAKK